MNAPDSRALAGKTRGAEGCQVAPLMNPVTTQLSPSYCSPIVRASMLLTDRHSSLCQTLVCAVDGNEVITQLRHSVARGAGIRRSKKSAMRFRKVSNSGWDLSRSYFVCVR